MLDADSFLLLLLHLYYSHLSLELSDTKVYESLRSSRARKQCLLRGGTACCERGTPVVGQLVRRDDGGGVGGGGHTLLCTGVPRS